MLAGILSALVVGTGGNAYAHSCNHGDCSYVWPDAILSSNQEIISYVSIIGMALVVVMLIFKFDYLQHRDFYVARYNPVSDHINRLLFEGRDKRKIVAAMPFLAFGSFLLIASLNFWLTYGDKVIERCYDDDTDPRPPGCEPTSYSAIAASVILFSLPFTGGGAFLLITGLKNVSLVTMKKNESIARC